MKNEDVIKRKVARLEFQKTLTKIARRIHDYYVKSPELGREVIVKISAFLDDVFRNAQTEKVVANSPSLK